MFTKYTYIHRSRSNKYDAIVIGLGASGVSAASQLARAGRRVLGLEADGRIGGRVRSQKVGGGHVELGAEWVLGERDNQVFSTALSKNIHMQRQDLGFRLLSSKKDKVDLDQAFYKELILFCIDAMEEKPDNNSAEDSVGYQISVRLNDYLKKNHPQYLLTKEYYNFRDFMNTLVSNYDSADDWKSSSANTLYQRVEGRQSMSWGSLGYKTLFDILLNTYDNGPGLPNLDVKLNCPVKQIDWSHDSATVVSCDDGSRYIGQHVIVTMSLGVLKERYNELFKPKLPQEKVRAINLIPMGAAGKIVLQFSHQWWSNDVSFFGFMWDRDEKMSVREEDRWTLNVSGASRSMGCDRTLTLWLSGEASKIVEKLPNDIVKTKAMGLIQRFMGSCDIPEPIEVFRSEWNSNPYTRGSYSFDNNYMLVLPEARDILAAPLKNAADEPRVFFAGEATSKTHYSTVHGAFESGVHEASKVLEQPVKHR